MENDLLPGYEAPPAKAAAVPYDPATAKANVAKLTWLERAPGADAEAYRRGRAAAEAAMRNWEATHADFLLRLKELEKARSERVIQSQAEHRYDAEERIRARRRIDEEHVEALRAEAARFAGPEIVEQWLIDLGHLPPRKAAK